MDERLTRRVEVREPSIALGALMELLHEQTGVALTVADSWRGTRLLVYAPDTPLQALMNAIPKALPMLEWRRRSSNLEGPPEYLLRPTRSDPPQRSELSPPEKLRAIRKLLQEARQLLARPVRELIEMYRAYQREKPIPVSATALEIALVLQDAYKNALSDEMREYLREFGAPGYAVRRDLYFPLLMQLRDADWNELAYQGYILRRLSRYPNAATWLKRFQNHWRDQPHSSQWSDLLLCIYYGAFTFDEKFIIWARPMIGERVLPQTLALEFGSLLSTVEIRAPLPPEPAEIIKERDQIKRLLERPPSLPRSLHRLGRLPAVPDWLKPKVNWYNHYSCFLLECAAALGKPMIGAYFPFMGAGTKEEFGRISERLRHREWGVLPNLLQRGLYEVEEADNWLILRHIAPYLARQDDHWDAVLKRMLPLPPPHGAPFFEAAVLRQQRQFYYSGVCELNLPDYPCRLRETPPLYPGPYFDAYPVSRMATAVSEKVAWEFYLALPPGLQARLKQGGMVTFYELDGVQKQRFLALLIGEVPPSLWESQTPLADLFFEGLPARQPPTVRLLYQRETKSVPEPNPEERRRILSTENQREALFGYIQAQERRSIERKRPWEQWSLQFRWDERVVEWTLVTRSAAMDWVWEEPDPSAG